MSDQQLLWLLRHAFSGHKFKEIIFHENGSMEVKFFDRGGNFFHETMREDNVVIDRPV